MRTPNGLRIDDPSWALIKAHIAFWGVTDNDGDPLGISLRCTGLATEPDYRRHKVKILSGPSAGQTRDITGATGGGIDTAIVRYPFTNGAGAVQQINAGTLFVILSDTSGDEDILLLLTGMPFCQEVVIYPVGLTALTRELADDGSNPDYWPVAAHSTAANAEGAPGVAWIENVGFESVKSPFIISIYAEFHWQTRFLVGGGAGTQSSSKIQISGDGGVTWVDLTDNFNNGATVMTIRNRAGVGRWLGATLPWNLSFRLVHWTNDAGGISTSEAQIRSDSYVRISYYGSP